MPSKRATSAKRSARVCVVVVGMHRSGTSALARVVSLLGAALPRNLLPANETNVAGHWEPQKVADLNDELLDSLGLTWDDIRPVPASWYRTKAAREFRRRAAELLREEYGDEPLFVLKDPRISRLLPLWTRALSDVDASPRFVLMVRNPIEVADSLLTRDGLSRPESLLLWLRHNVEAARAIAKGPHALVSFDRLLAAWTEEMTALSTGLGISWPQHDEVAAEVESFLDDALRHHRHDFAELEKRSELPDLVRSTYEAFEAAARSHEPLDSGLAASVAEELERADDVYAAALGGLLGRLRDRIDELTAGRDAASDALATIHTQVERQQQRILEREAEIVALQTEVASARRTADPDPADSAAE